MLSLLVALALAAVPPQSTPAPSQPPSALRAPTPPQAELAGGISATAEDYLAHLYAEIGSARWRELLLDKALAKEVAALDLASLPTATAAALHNPDQAARDTIATRISQEFAGDRASYTRDLAVRGVRADEALWMARQQTLRDTRIAALVQSRRDPTAPALRRVFETHFGVDGLQVVVRHIFQSFGTERHKLQAAGETAEPTMVEEIVRKRVAALLAQHQGGTPFHLLVARGSEDPQGRALALSPATAERAGEISGYNFQHFGPEFAAAVRGMQPGEVRGPVRTSHGYHIIWLVSAKRTEFAAVEAQVRTLLREEPPSLAERRTLLDALAKQYGIDRG